METEGGGSTTQSGIYYQNTIAALYLGRMLDPRISDLTQKVIAVRVEAREYVDDIVLVYADGHSRFIQAKVNIKPSPGDKKWRKLWGDFENQCWDVGFKNEDRLVIYLGKLDNWFSDLNSLCERSRGAKDLNEWQDILSNQVLGKRESEVRQFLSPEHQNLADSLRLLSVVEVEQAPLDNLESLVPAWMPPCNKGETILFTSLRDLCGGNARNKLEMDETNLVTRLKNKFGIEISSHSSTEDHKITGSVLFEDGRPVENACVRVIGLDLDPVTTGSDGYFEFLVGDQQSWVIQVEFKNFSAKGTYKKADLSQPIIIKFPLMACFSIDSPMENEEIPLGEEQGRILEGSLPILDQLDGIGEVKVDVDVYQFPQGNSIRQSGKYQISAYQGKWFYVKAKFDGEGAYDVVAKATIGKYADFRKVRVKCIDKGKYYQQAIAEDRNIRGITARASMKSVAPDLDTVKANYEQILYRKQEEFFDYFNRRDYKNASLVVNNTLEILDQILPIFLPKYPDDFWLQNVRAYTFKNYAMLMRELGNKAEFFRGLSEAEKMFKAIRDQDPKDAGAWNGLGSVAALRGEYEKALEYIDKALEIEPNYEAAKFDKENILRFLDHGR